jgi:molybdopterin-synthase adenylyltransferase
MSFSAALTTDTHRTIADHLLAATPNEDICFALWRPSHGAERTTALVCELVPPIDGDRQIHGNASFSDRYFFRAADLAADTDAGLALLHTHPGAHGWQRMSADDVNAERGHAAQTLVLTEMPLVGMTLAGDGSWSARFWERNRKDIERRSCENVRVVGEQLRITYDDQLRPPPETSKTLLRTISAWGERVQDDLARLRVGILGAGSVGALIAECLSRTGIEHVRLLDFDVVKRHNLDRLLHATARDARLGRRKVDVVRAGLLRSATAADPRIDALPLSVVEPAGLAAALDCDVLFSCVDRPWPRLVLNQVAYAHLIPVVDGGIYVNAGGGRGMQGAEWSAQIAAPGRRCLECGKRFDAAFVQAERDGLLEDQRYLDNLPPGHPLVANENVFAFSMSTAAFEVGQFLSMLVAPAGLPDNGAQLYHFHLGTLDLDTRDCEPGCYYATNLLARGDQAQMLVGRHDAAEEARRRYAERDAGPQQRLARGFDWLGVHLARLETRLGRISRLGQ